MSASDNLSSALFHGTTHAFKKGDIVLPKKRGVAWATTDKKFARGWAAHRSIKGGSPQVYLVEPIDHEEVKATNKKHGMYPGTHISTKGFRVLKKA